MPSMQYEGSLRVIVPTLRSSLTAGEDLNLKVIILAQGSPEDAMLHWRALGEGNFNRIPLAHIARGVYSARIPTGRIETDIEYYVKVNSADGQKATFPASAPNINQTVLIITE